MSNRTANVMSIDALRALKVALQRFETDAINALVQLELEGRRPVAWIEQDRALYWPRETRKASDAVSEARIALERCEVTTSAEDQRYCYDERKLLEKAKRRLRLCEEKVQAVRRWRVRIRKEVDEFAVQIAKLKRYLENDLVRGIAALERMSGSLEQYVQRRQPATAESGFEGLPDAASAAVEKSSE